MSHTYGCPQRDLYSNQPCRCHDISMQTTMSENTAAMVRHTEALQADTSKDDELTTLRAQLATLTAELTTSHARAERLAEECRVWRKRQEYMDESRAFYPWPDLDKARIAVDAARDLERKEPHAQ